MWQAILVGVIFIAFIGVFFVPELVAVRRFKKQGNTCKNCHYRLGSECFRGLGHEPLPILNCCARWSKDR